MAMEEVLVVNKEEEGIDLPPGFRFHPTDEEIITHYLSEKVVNPSFSATAVGEVDLNKCEPWDLPSKAKMGEKEWYFFCQKDRKYPTGMRTNRATESGYWKATGKDKEIYRGKGVLVGMKKTLVFYKGRAPKGEKTNWVMHEFRLEGKTPYINLPRTARDEWVVCRVFHKNMGIKKSPMAGVAITNSFGEDLMDSPTLPPLVDPPYFNSNTRAGFSYEEGLDFKGFLSSSPPMPSYFSNMGGMQELQDYNKSFLPNNNPPPSSAFYPQPQFASPTPYIPPQQPANSSYLHQDLDFLRAFADAPAPNRRHCKVEQFSNQSMVSASQDTGTEISSVVSKQEMGSSRSYDDIDDPTSVGQILDLDNMWKY